MADTPLAPPSLSKMISSNGATSASSNGMVAHSGAEQTTPPPTTTPDTTPATARPSPATVTPESGSPESQVTHQQHSPFAPPASPSPAADQPDQSAQDTTSNPDNSAAQSAISFVAELRSRGFDVPEGLDDSAALDLVTQQIDEANRLAEQYSASAPGMTPKTPSGRPDPLSAPENNENALPAQPAVGDPASTSASGAGTPPKLSEEARLFAANGLLKRGENGWVAENPAFQGLADEHTRLDAYRQERAHKLLDNTDEFISPYVTKLLEDRTKPLQEQVERLVAQIESRENLTRESEIEQWVDSNADALFVNGDRNQLTPYAQQFNTFASQLEQISEEFGQKLSRADLHNRTLKMMQKAGIQPAAPPPASAPERPEEPRQSFLQAASTSPPFSEKNRLTEYTAATQPTGTPHLPMGPGGTPSLARLIQMKQQGQA